MKHFVIYLILLIYLPFTSIAADSTALQENAPERYTVQKGDSLWSIAGRFLKDPWKWPELLKLNADQIKSPHLIFPGDVIVLELHRDEVNVRVITQSAPEITPTSTSATLEPKPRIEAFTTNFIPSIPLTALSPFLNKHLLLNKESLNTSGHVLSSVDQRLLLSTYDEFYARGIHPDQGDVWLIYRQGQAIIDPANNQLLGYDGIYLGEAKVVQHGELSKLMITTAVKDIYRDDRLISARTQIPSVFSFIPHPPVKPISGHIISTSDGAIGAGTLSIVLLTKGKKDGVDIGSVFAISRKPLELRDDSTKFFKPKNTLNIPDQRLGLVMVFNVFDNASYGLIMSSTQPIKSSDRFSNP